MPPIHLLIRGLLVSFFSIIKNNVFVLKKRNVKDLNFSINDFYDFMDETDEKIIEIMRLRGSSGYMPSDRQIAKQIGVSQPTVSRRIKGLVKSGLKVIPILPPKEFPESYLFVIKESTSTALISAPRLEQIREILKKDYKESIQTVYSTPENILALGKFKTYSEAYEVLLSMRQQYHMNITKLIGVTPDKLFGISL